jgi:acetylornithine deacetylase
MPTYDLERLLMALIRVDTCNPGGDEPALSALLAEELRRAPHPPDEVLVGQVPRPGAAGVTGAWVFARWGTPRLLVNAHLDTVSAGPGWSRPPHEAYREGGRIYGLGAADTKGAIAAALAALDLIDGPPRDLGLLFSGDEEGGSSCLPAFLAAGHARHTARVIVCEPTSLRAGTRHRGIVALRMRRKGEGGHSSRADHLPAPVAELARAAVAADDWGRRRRGEGPPGFAGMCLNVARLEGGVAFNVVPADASLSLSLRPPPGADTEGLLADLQAALAQAAPLSTTQVELANPPFATREVEGFRSLLGEVVDAPVDLGFWTEAAVFAAAGMDAVVCGPGDIAQAHAADEWVEVAQLYQARDLFARAYRRPMP